MSIDTLDNVVELNLQVRRGNSFHLELTLSECGDSVIAPLSLDGYTLAAQIRDRARGRVWATIQVTVTDESAGEISLDMTTAVTGALQEGEYVWDLLAVADATPTTSTVTLVSGTVTVTDIVTLAP